MFLVFVVFSNLNNRKFFKADELLLFLHKKEVLSIFFRTAELQKKLLILIESPNIFQWKLAKKKKVGVVFRAKLGPML